MNKAETQFHKKALEYLSFEKAIFDRARQIAWFPGGNYDPLPDIYKDLKLKFNFKDSGSVDFVTVVFLYSYNDEDPWEVDITFQELSLNKEDWEKYVLFYRDKCEKNIQRIIKEGKK